MVHGRISHGRQYEDGERRALASAYYHQESGGGLAILEHPARRMRALRIGVVGLGVGTVATHARREDTLRFYEISPVVTELAREHFTYLRDCESDVQIVPGDARLSLQREDAAGEPRFDALLVDAFSSDAIPRHLLTRECFALYRKRVQPDGIIAFHITNRVLDLSPVVRALAEDAGMTAVVVDQERVDGRPDVYRNRWVLVTGNRAWVESPAVASAASPVDVDEPEPLLWTDDFGGIRGLFE